MLWINSYLCYNTYPLLKLPFDARFVAISRMELKSGFLSLENFKAALSRIQRQPKQECIKGLPICSLAFISCLDVPCQLDICINTRCSCNSSVVSYVVPRLLDLFLHLKWLASIPSTRNWSILWNLFRFS